MPTGVSLDGCVYLKTAQAALQPGGRVAHPSKAAQLCTTYAEEAKAKRIKSLRGQGKEPPQLPSKPHRPDDWWKAEKVKADAEKQLRASRAIGNQRGKKL